MDIGEIAFGVESQKPPPLDGESKSLAAEEKKARGRKKSAEAVEGRGASADVKPDAETTAKEKPVYTTYEDYDPEDLYTYAGVDVYATSTIISRMFPKFVEQPEYKVSTTPGRIASTKAPPLLQVYEECTQTIFDFVCDLELAGINYDVEANRRLDKEMREEVLELEDRIFSKLGKRINLDSSDSVSKLLYGELGFEAPHKTKSGADSTDGTALLLLAGLDPISPGKYLAPDPEKQFLADIAKRKNLASVHRGFISTYMDDYLQPDGRIHALYNQFGTATFRLSSSEPNLNVSWASRR